MCQPRHIYFISIKGKFHNKPHPHVDLSGSGRERLVVPCFTRGGDELESEFADQKNAGFAPEHIYVETDNSRCVKWNGNYLSSVSWWLLHRAWWQDEDLLYRPVGILDAASVEAIARAMIGRDNRKKGSWLSPKSRKLLLSLTAPNGAVPPTPQVPGAQ